MRRFVIDANVLASGSVEPQSESPPSVLYRELTGTLFEAVVCAELLAEVAEALGKPYFSNRVGAEEAADIVTGIAEAATVLDDPLDPPAILRDAEDDYLVALARQGGVEAIITGDKDLIDEPNLDPPAIGPRQACKVLGLLD